MLKKKVKFSFSTRIPTLKHKGSEFKPDFILMIKDGVVKLSCLDMEANLSQLIYQVDEALDLLKDYRWAQNKRREKK